jgi:transcriptional regulator with XRE-family HTH domain
MADEDAARTAALETVAEQLISARAARGLEVEFAAELAHVDPERLAGAEAAELALTEEELQRLADTYEVGITAFFGGRVTPVSYLFGA